jgi:hypothetical protein
MRFPSFVGSAIVCLSLAFPAAAEAPRGSITIERISQIKYPSAPAWSPDGKMVAFLGMPGESRISLSSRPANVPWR